MKKINNIEIPDVGEASWFLTYAGDGHWITNYNKRCVGNDDTFVADVISGEIFTRPEQALAKAQALSEAYAKAMTWVPAPRELYYFVTTEGDVIEAIATSDFSGGRGKFGNYFKTYDLANATAAKIRELLQGLPHS